jgi:hypothetical protein
MRQMTDVPVSVICAAVVSASVLVDGKTLLAPPRGTRNPRTRSNVRAGSATIAHAMAVDINATRRNFCTRQLFAHTRRADVVEIILDRGIAGATTDANDYWPSDSDSLASATVFFTCQWQSADGHREVAMQR